MRVIAGNFRSRPLHSLRGMDLRPTADRLRETMSRRERENDTD